jgi:hypothetical protein
MDCNHDKKNPDRCKLITLMHSQKKIGIDAERKVIFFLIREEILLQVRGIGISPLLPVAPVSRVIS